MKTNPPYFSIIVPVYNVISELKRCMDSLLNQTFHKYEIILVDDGSADGSGELCDQFAQKRDFVRVVHKMNAGLSSARNVGLDLARGEYLVFVDADDYVEQDLLRLLKRHLDVNPGEMLKYGFRRVIGGKKTGNIQIPYYEERVYNKKDIREILLPGAIGPARLFDYRKNAVLSVCACTYSRKFLKTYGIRFLSEREILNEDFLFNIHAMLYANQIEVTHYIMYNYNTRSGSLSKRYQKNMMQRKQKLLGYYKKHLQEVSLFHELETAYYSFYADCMYACITNECRYQTGGRTGTQNRIREILYTPQCCEALEKCNHKGLTLKGLAIYILMKQKAVKAIYYLYRARTKGNNE